VSTPNPPSIARSPLNLTTLVSYALCYGLATFFVSACGDGSMGGASTANLCATDSDCPAPLTCQANLCVDASVTTLPIALQLRFPKDPGDLRRQVTGLIFEPGLPLPDIEPRPLVTVTVDAPRWTTAVTGKVFFKAQQSIPGTTIEVWTDITEDGGSVQLLAGTYEVTVRPSENTNLPYRVFRGVEVAASPGGQSTQLSLPLVKGEEGEKFVIITGKVALEYVGTSREVDAQHVKVRAESSDGQHVSPTYTTCTGQTVCDGTFELWLPAQRQDETREYRLHIGPTADNLIPEMALEPFTIGPETFANPMETTPDTIKVSTSTHVAKRVPENVKVRGRVVAADTGLPIPKAFVSATGKVGDDLEFSTSIPVLAQDDGSFELSVPNLVKKADVDGLSAEFSVRVNVEQSSPFASAHFDALSAFSQDIELELEPKVTMTGQVFGRAVGEPVANTLVSVARTSTTGETVLGTPLSATTDGNGTFEMPIEPGAYEVTLIPPSSSGLPWSVKRVTVARKNNPDVKATLGKSSVVYGTIRDTEGGPAKNVAVEIFAHDRELGQAQLLTATTTDEMGYFRAVIPNPDEFEF